MTDNLVHDDLNKKPRWFKFRKLKIREAISWVFCTMLIISTLITTTYTYVNVTTLMDVTARDLISKNQNTIVNETMAYLKPAMQITQMGSLIFKSVEPDILDSSLLMAFLLGGLKIYPQSSLFYAADSAGNYIAVGNKLDKRVYAFQPNKPLPHNVSYFVEITDRRHNNLKNLFRYLNNGGELLGEEYNPIVGEKTYDPRSRVWFKRTAQLKAFNWSEVYIGWNTTDFMITASSPIFDANHNLAAIIAVDIPLERINNLLARQKASHSGINFIINKQGEVISFPESGRNLLYKDGIPQIKRLEEMNEPALLKAFNIYQKTHKNQFEFNYDNIDFYAFFINLPDVFASPWTLVMVAPVDDFIGSIKETNRDVLLIALLIIGIATLFLVVFSHKISYPIETLADQMHRIKDLDMDGEESSESPLQEISSMEKALSSMKDGLGAFSKFVPKELAHSLITGGVIAELGGKRRALAIMFCDIANFTTISEGMASDRLMLHLSDYLNRLSRIIIKNKGTIDKYIGDAIMAFWGAPLEDENCIYNACHSVLMCHRRLLKINKEWEAQGVIPLPTRFGLHYGEVIVGNVGSADRLNYTVIGDSVNLASRLEGTNKNYGTSILVSETIYNQMQQKFLMRPIDIVAVKGKAKSIRIYELLAELGDNLELGPNESQIKCAKLTHQAFDLYIKRNWVKAQKIYLSLLKLNPADQVAALYVERCQHNQENPPPEDWDGVYHLTTK